MSPCDVVRTFLPGPDPNNALETLISGVECHPVMLIACTTWPCFKALTTQAPVVLFMKGDREEPRCGFSKKVVAAIQNTGVAFETFDILSDEDVRQVGWCKL
jgi:hypothetical protein